MMVQVAENQLSLTPRIGRHDDAVAAVEQLGDYTDLFQYPAVGFVAFLGTDLTGNEQELIGNDWQVVPAEALDAVAVRQCWLHQMTESPCHIVAVAIHITVFGFCRAHQSGDLTSHARFFCNDCLHILLVLLFGFSGGFTSLAAPVEFPPCRSFPSAPPVSGAVFYGRNKCGSRPRCSIASHQSPCRDLTFEAVNLRA